MEVDKQREWTLDIRLEGEMIVDGVVFKKRLGRLSVLDGHISWTADGSTGESPEVSIPYGRIKAQLVNVPRQSGKIILKLDLHSESNSSDTPSLSFIFKGSKGLDERERVKNFIAARLSETSGTPSLSRQSSEKGIRSLATGLSSSVGRLKSEEIQARQALLLKDKHLAQLHRDWVVQGGLISEEEFWESRKQALADQSFMASQKRGTASSLLSDIKPTSTDGSDIKYTLNAEIIHSIFIQYPAVHRAYQENVPDNVSEKEFWIKYFSSQYFYRKRAAGGAGLSQSSVGEGGKGTGDLFEKYAAIDADDTALTLSQLQYNPRNRLLDLSSTQEDHKQTGNEQDFTMRPGGVKESLSLIRKFNRHSELVLKGSLTNEKPGEPDEQYLAETEIENLEVEKEPALLSLDIQDATRYFPGSSLVNKDNDGNESDPDVLIVEPPIGSYEEWCPKLSSITLEQASSSKCPTLILNSFASILKRKRDSEESRLSTLEQSPSFVKAQNLLSSVNELLRHSWSLRLLKEESIMYGQNGSVSSKQEAKSARILHALRDLLSRARTPEFGLDMSTYGPFLDSLEARVSALSS